jgi:subtilisin family serine protease
LINFKASLVATNHQLLQNSEVFLEDHLGESAYVALIRSTAFITNPAVSSLVFAAEPLLPGDKIQISTNLNEVTHYSYDAQSNTVQLLVEFWGVIEAPEVIQALGSIGLAGTEYGADNSWLVIVPSAPPGTFVQKLADLALLPSVRVIEEGPLPFLPLNNKGRIAANTDAAQGFTFPGPAPNPAKPQYMQLSGNGIRIGICDDGIYENHNDFKNINNSGSVVGTRIVHSRVEEAEHGTHVASIAAGNGYLSQANFGTPFKWRGHGPQACIGDYPHFGGQANVHFDALVTDGMNVLNHSYVQSLGSYTIGARSLDKIVSGTGKNTLGNLIPARPSIWAAGNNHTQPEYGTEMGYFSVLTSAKNTISVGSVDTDTSRRSYFSSLGPTFDGRIKPDLVAPGNDRSVNPNGIMAALYDLSANGPGGQGYTMLYGSSMAAPVVTGIVGLMMEEYSKSCPGCSELPPSMYKAILIQTATDLTKSGTEPEDTNNANPDTMLPTLYFKGPDFATGYGLVNGDAARLKIGEPNQWGVGIINHTADSQTWCIQVPAGASELKVVIAWDDREGSTLLSQASRRLVNDLDLELTDPNGVTCADCLPLILDPPGGSHTSIPAASITSAHPGVDRINNVEMVVVNLPQPGVWTAVVSGHAIPFASGQPYSLVSSYEVSELCGRRPERVLLGNICNIIPEFCNQRYIPMARLEIVDGRILLPTRQPILLDELCRHTHNCPGCGTADQIQFCAGFDWNIVGLPDGAEMILFNDRGEIISRSSNGILAVPRATPGERRFMAIYSRNPNELERYLRLRFELKASS